MRTLTLIFAVLAGAHAAMAQVARITVTDGAASSLAGAVALVVGYDPGAATNPRLREIGVLTYPRTVLVDRRGVIVALDAELRGTALDSTIARFVNR